MARRCWPDGTPWQGGHWIYRGRRYALYLRDRLACVYCTADALVVCQERGGFTLDHLVPLQNGGAKLDPSNLITACMSCNQRKGVDVADVLGSRAVERSRRAIRRPVPETADGLDLFKRSRGALGVAREAWRRGLLTPASVAYFVPTLDLSEKPDDDIPF